MGVTINYSYLCNSIVFIHSNLTNVYSITEHKFFLPQYKNYRKFSYLQIIYIQSCIDHFHHDLSLTHNSIDSE